MPNVAMMMTPTDRINDQSVEDRDLYGTYRENKKSYMCVVLNVVVEFSVAVSTAFVASDSE